MVHYLDVRFGEEGSLFRPLRDHDQRLQLEGVQDSVSNLRIHLCTQLSHIALILFYCSLRADKTFPKINNHMNDPPPVLLIGP